MKPIAIITATPNGINPGMLAGEAAAKAAMEKAGFTQETTFFRLLSLEERILGQKSQNEELNKAYYVGIADRTISDPVILDDYLPLFWGNFLHMRRYINALAGSDPNGTGLRPFVTGTYHVAVSSWALGIPAILVTGSYHDGERAGKEINLRTRLDKRTILMGQDGLLDFCIDPPLLTSANRAAVCARLISSIVENQIGKSFRHVLARRVENSQEALLSAVTALR